MTGRIATTPAVTLRPATPADAVLLRRWEREPHIVAALGSDGDWNWEAELPRAVPWREFLIAAADGAPIGFVQIIDPAEEETHYWGACGPNLRAIDIWIGVPDRLGRGIGTAMMRLAIARCFAVPEVVAIVIDPLAGNLRAHRFYERLGFRPVGPRRFGDDDCLVLRLDRDAATGNAPQATSASTPSSKASTGSQRGSVPGRQ